MSDQDELLSHPRNETDDLGDTFDNTRKRSHPDSEPVEVRVTNKSSSDTNDLQFDHAALAQSNCRVSQRPPWESRKAELYRINRLKQLRRELAAHTEAEARRSRSINSRVRWLDAVVRHEYDVPDAEIIIMFGARFAGSMYGNRPVRSLYESEKEEEHREASENGDQRVDGPPSKRLRSNAHA